MAERSESVSSSPDPPLSRVLKGGWRWLVAGALLGLAVGVALLMVLPKSYTSVTAVIVRPVAVLDNVGTSPSEVTEVNLDTEAQLVQSLDVAENARDKLGTGAPEDELLTHVDVSVPPNTTILTIRYAGDTANAAREGAAAFADAYLEVREDSAEVALSERREILDDQERTLSRDLKALSRAVAESEVGSSKRLALSAGLQLLQAQLGEIQSSQVGLESTGIAPGEVVSPAELPENPTNPKPTLVLPSALSVGLLGGILLAWSTRWRRERLLSPRDVAELGDAQVLGVCNAAEGDADRGVQQLIQTLVADGQDLAAPTRGRGRAGRTAVGARRTALLLVPASTRQSSLSLGLVVARQLARLMDHCLVVIHPEENGQINKRDADYTHLTIRTADGEHHRHWTRNGTPIVFVSRPLKNREDRPIGGIDFAVVTVLAGSTTAAQLRNTVTRLEGSGVTVRGVLLDRGTSETEGSPLAEHEGGVMMPRQNDPSTQSRPSTMSSAPDE